MCRLSSKVTLQTTMDRIMVLLWGANTCRWKIFIGSVRCSWIKVKSNIYLPTDWPWDLFYRTKFEMSVNKESALSMVAILPRTFCHTHLQHSRPCTITMRRAVPGAPDRSSMVRLCLPFRCRVIL
jgi:hypothetical protein